MSAKRRPMGRMVRDFTHVQPSSLDLYHTAFKQPCVVFPHLNFSFQNHFNKSNHLHCTETYILPLNQYPQLAW